MRPRVSAPTGSVRDATRRRAVDSADAQLDFARAVRFYLQLSPRQLPSRFLYDTLGSALFDAICHLPWYRITRAELHLLAQYAPTLAPVLERGRVVELGCGSGEKLAVLLAHAAASGVHAHLIDLSDAALSRAQQTLAALDGLDLRVSTHRTTYEEGLLTLPADDGRRTLVAFLGSNIGNFDPPGAAAFLALIRGALHPGDHLLLGADLVKPERDLLLAYDDPLGLTAAFNRNLLLRLNTELDADFDHAQFGHRAVWNADASRIEMHLVSRAAQRVRLPRCDLTIGLEDGETIWTESSYKYDPAAICDLVEPSGFEQRSQWIDEEARFALTLFEAA
jgi:dimethylhistidine N-methyltransferase